ncbi:MAG TPA: S53 family peptidase [Usitatibacter sp.]|nr:S53 family peptidase [Usitatibacter sp.]
MKTTRAIGLGALLFGVALTGAGGALAQYKKPYAIKGEAAVPVAATPASTAHFTCELRPFDGSKGIVCYGPDAIRKAYGLDGIIAGGINGTGQTIVIIDAYGSPTLEADVQAFSALFGLPPADITQIRMPGSTPFDFNDNNQLGWAEESSLDVQWAHAIAPGAKIILVAAATNNDDDMLAAQNYAISQKLGSILSESFGESELALQQLGPAGQAIFDANEKSYKTAGDHKISVLVSAGDDGAAGFDVNGVLQTVPVANYPASSPNVTTVGGTNLFFGTATNATPNGTYQGEVVWNEGPGSATGGGISKQFRLPDYQEGTKHLIPTSTGRGYPDVAYNAGVFGGVIVRLGFFGGFFVFGGTSAGAPQWAGITALINQASKQPAGFLNKSLYKLGKLGVLQPLMHDITVGDNSDLDDGVVGFSAQPGWDYTTGWGTPNAGLLGALMKDNGKN